MIDRSRRRVVLATRNRHKLVELGRMLGDVGVELVSLDEVAPDAPELIEDGETFRENALTKARQASAITGLPALADDSGLEVDFLGGAPGIYSARFAGRHGDHGANIALLLERLAEVEDERRTARFRCVIALVEPSTDGAPGPREFTFDGTCEGRIAWERRGEGGFGYDPIFFLPERGLTVAELEDRQKDAVSHRGRAARALRRFLETMG